MLKKPKLKVTLTIRDLRFEAAHNLYEYKGKCQHLHGHSYRMEVSIRGEIDPKTGMVCDFGKVKNIVNSRIIEKYDHTYLNDMLDYNPTAENMVVDFFNNISSGLKHDHPHIELCSVKLWETDKCCAEVSI